ncbi:M56 family metallopeptidase [uncultured Jatrophihabitans sp.]|uniref:M56 family metallopeptidase n=1 Tax=uncultured Jatrophihabitans sp. TaxID=1610747 RepID=UPI0035CAAD5F
MIAAGVLPLVVGVLLALAGPALGRRLPGRAAAVLLTLVGVADALATGVVLCAVAVLALAQWRPLASLEHWSTRAIASSDPVPAAPAIACGALAVGLLAAAAVRALAIVRGIAGSASLCRRLGREHGGLIVLDGPDADAYALAGMPGRIVVTRPMLRTLSAQERRALLAHEHAHVTHYHFLYVQVIRLAAAANPLLRPLVAAVRVAVERWADDEAARQLGDRRLVATTLARAGLARGSAAVPAGALAAAATDVRQRVDALLRHDEVRGRRGAVAVLVAMAACCVVGAGVVGLHAHAILEWAQAVGWRRAR